MSDPKQTLTGAEVVAAGLQDWRQLRDVLRARFSTGDFATGLALVDRIGALAEAADHHPDVTLTYGDVVVSVTSHDVQGITSRDIALAEQISAAASEAGVPADVSGLTLIDIGLDTAQPAENAQIYAALLNSRIIDGEPVDASGQAPTLWWQGPVTPDTPADQRGPELPEQTFDQRWHLDVWVPLEEAPRRLDAVLAAGGVLVSDRAAPDFWVVEDAEGNRSCICTSAQR